MEDMRYKAWLVDLDGTLYRSTPVKLAMAAELALTGPMDLASLQAFRYEHEAMREEGRSHEPNPYREQLRRAAARLGVDEARLEQKVTKWMQMRPRKWIRLFARKPLIAELRAYRKGGGKLALVSDYPGLEKLKALGLESDFDAVVCNGEEGSPARLKPAPDGYLLAAERVGCAPADCLVIGDREDADGLAAREAGMGFRKV